MKRLGLVTLADLPDLAAGKNPRSTIVVARLDDKLRDPRYGAFKISQADVDGWKRNLTEVFGGRVSIDADHSSDRGQGTRAMGWITNIGQDGKLVTADVEWTPKGAKSIRNGDYRHVSATFTPNYTDEHGDKHGKALIGAALTNRPVLRKGMPCLSLSRDDFDGLPLARSKKSKPKKQIRKALAAGEPVSISLKRLRKLALAAGADPERTRMMTRPGVDPELRALWVQSLAPGGSRTVTLDADDRERARTMMQPGVDPELRELFLAQEMDQRPEPTGGTAPLGMDDDRYQLHTEAKQLAQTRCDANPRLDPAETYALAAIEIADRGSSVI